MKADDWNEKLSTSAKAELLGNVLHDIQFDEGVWPLLPVKYQNLIRAARRSCGVWHEELTKEDIKNIRSWYAEVKE